MQDLVDAWQSLLARHTASADRDAVGSRLIAAWAEPHRRYHSIAHLRDILGHVEELADYADDPDAVRLAAWYHDAVYQGLPDDEERSALRAEAELGRLNLDPALIVEVARLIRMTVTHAPESDDRNGQVLSDADLASLAVSPAHYQSNTAAIRSEYAHVPDEVFRKGRMQVLVKLLEGPGVFYTEYGRSQWEDAAQDNLRAELAALSN
jgi:predicted metal-dependent HD superfamily phosphohydrolase